jgi:uncharacterized protein YfaS (alpha-2-macroglobulin family)
MKAHLFSLFCLSLGFVAGCSHKSEESAGARLVLSTAGLEAGTTFEARFDEPMARAEVVGIEAKPSPLIFTPDLPGQFVWTSARGGVFTPSEPMALGTEYELSLRRGLRQADGRETQARLRKVLRAPDFGVVSVSAADPSTNAYSEPEVRLWFNADVKADEVRARAGFVSAEGRWMPAAVRQGLAEENYGGWGRSPKKTWREQFDEQRREPKPGRRVRAPREETGEQEIRNLVVVTPQQPLKPGRRWKLVVAAGVPSADGRFRSPAASETEVGDVVPFTFSEFAVHHYVGGEPFVQIKFSKALDPALTNSFADWVEISPHPAKVEAQVLGAALSLSGSWEGGTNYRVTLRRGLPAAEAFGLGAPETFSFEVPPIAPRLYFPAFATEQWAGGARKFPLLAVNVERVRLRAKLLEPSAAIHALEGYETYAHNEGQYHPWGADFRRLDYKLFAGRTVYNDELPGPATTDAAEEIPLEWDRLLDGRKTGLIFLEAERARGPYGGGPPPLGTQALIQLTDLGMAWKSGGNELQVYVFSYSSGQPVAGARVQFYSSENEALTAGRTDSAGRASLPASTNATWVLAQAGDDFHAVRFGEHNIPRWLFDLPSRWNEPEGSELRRTALFTDRDVYQPGETVNLKAIVRDLTEAGLTIPAGNTGRVTCADSRGREFFRTNLVLSDLGSCSAAIALPSGPRGDYTLAFRMDGSEKQKEIIVADYQPNAFEISVGTKPAYAPGETPRIPVSARYFFGKSLNRARLKWSLEAQDQSLKPQGFEAFEFARSFEEQQWGRGVSSFTTTGEGLLTEGSNWVITAQTPINPTAPQPRAVSLLVEVTDLNQQTLTRSAAFVQHSSAFYLGLKKFEQVVEAGKELPVEIAAVAAGGDPWSEPTPAHLKLQRVEWNSVRVQGAGRTARYRNEATLTAVMEKEVVVSPPTKSSRMEKEFHGATVEGIIAPEAGQYLLEVTSRDAAGHEVASSVSFNVSEEGKLAWNYRNEVEIKLVPDKPAYAPGDTAVLLVKTPISGTAWVTVERGKVLRSFATRLEGNAPTVQVPLEAPDAPNVFVSVTLVRGAAESPHKAREPEYRVGYCQLDVEDPATRLTVEVTAGETNCLPGEVMTVEGRVTDTRGQSLRDAEVTLYVVDEGVLSLSDYTVPDLHQMLLARQNLGVNSGVSLPFLLTEDPERLSFQNKGYLGGGGGRERLRHRFRACAFWNANLRTDEQGKITARFTAPDSMTRYKIIAVAQRGASEFGSASSVFTVSKPLMVEPAVPKVAHVTDRLRARGVVLNQTDEAGDVIVSLQLDDKARFGDGAKSQQTVSIGAHGSTIVEFPVEIMGTGAANWTWRARFAAPPSSKSEITAVSYSESRSAGKRAAFTDAVRSTVEVGPLMPALRDVALVQAESGETNLLASIDPQTLAGEGTVTVTIANTRLVLLGEAVAQLLHYPYGCVEQTSSSLLPWILLNETPELAVLTQRDTNEAPAVVKLGVERLFSMQTSSGGLSYWPGGHEPMLWGSAYGGFVLALAREGGMEVPDEGFGRLMRYLSSQLRDDATPGRDAEDECLALCALALAGRAEPAYCERLFARREQLSDENRALLALAIVAGQGEGRMAEELLRPRVGSRRAPAGPFDNAARVLAIRLLALASYRPNGEEAARIFDQLQQERRKGHWWTTQGNAWAVLAVHRYTREGERLKLQTSSLRKASSSNLQGRGGLVWGKERAGFELGAGRGIFTHTFALNEAVAEKPLRLTRSPGQPWWVQVAVESRSRATNRLAEDHGLSVQRRYDLLSDDNEPRPWDMSPGSLGVSPASHGIRARVGDRVLVTLHLTAPEPAAYVVVDDPLPSVLEPINTEFKTQQLAGGQTPAWLARDSGGYWEDDFREIRAGRMLFFADQVGRGTYVLRYVARVRAAGTATAPPAKAEEMYHPDRFGLTDTPVVKTEAGE